jgi:serine/threonine protein kinase
LFQSAHYQAIFAHNQLHDFDAIWAREIDWFEAPNERRGGWSGVGCLQLDSPLGTSLRVFVKKQQNHGRFSLRNPIKGEPTFRREFEHLTFLEEREFDAPRVVFYGEQSTNQQTRAILITVELAGFISLDTLSHQIATKGKMSAQKKRMLLASIASKLRCFHQLNLMHRALYPKHILVATADTAPQIALIDLEKARFSPVFWNNAYFDLAALTRHAEHWSRTQRLYFFLQYCQLKQLTGFSKWLCRLIIKRAMRKKSGTKIKGILVAK